jgi:hypothetical protein
MEIIKLRKWLIIWAMILLHGCDISQSPYINEVIPNEYLQILKSRLNQEYNQKYAFFIDFEKPSNEYRFYVLRLIDNKIINKGLCCNGKEDSNGKVIFSNVSGSNCSSNGAYKIGAPYVGKFGKSFKLHGIDKSNSNAYDRNIVLHSYNGVPRTPCFIKIFKSEGCPTVNPDFLKEIETFIINDKKPIMLYIKK